ncbi:MAG: hypothetical protein KF716_22740 [Anaerolineae bacterium]|nr:hypothetical protein [Anaerolineae bacterium]
MVSKKKRGRAARRRDADEGFFGVEIASQLSNDSMALGIGEKSIMQFKRLGLLALVLIGLFLGVHVGRTVLAQDINPPPIKLYVGTITDNADLFVGITIFDGRATIYICDGQADKGTVSTAEWFIGAVKDSAIDVTAPSGNSVHVDLTDTDAIGQFTFKDGTIKKFDLKRGDGQAGLFRSEFTLADVSYVGGWLTLPDGTVRGAIRRVGDGTSNTSILSPASFAAFRPAPIVGGPPA